MVPQPCSADLFSFFRAGFEGRELTQNLTCSSVDFPSPPTSWVRWGRATASCWSGRRSRNLCSKRGNAVAGASDGNRVGKGCVSSPFDHDSRGQPPFPRCKPVKGYVFGWPKVPRLWDGCVTRCQRKNIPPKHEQGSSLVLHRVSMQHVRRVKKTRAESRTGTGEFYTPFHSWAPVIADNDLHASMVPPEPPHAGTKKKKKKTELLNRGMSVVGAFTRADQSRRRTRKNNNGREKSGPF